MSMILHKGARYVARQELALAAPPAALARYMPVPHDFLADSVQNVLEDMDFEITQERHGLSPNGSKYFGLFNLANPATDYAPMVGFRSSYDKSLAIRIALGSNVFICDNLALSGEIEAFRKHTTEVFRDLPILLRGAFGGLRGRIQAQGVEFEEWRERDLAPPQIDHLIGRIARAGAVPASRVGELFTEQRFQTHDHGAPTLWRVYNATTEVLKGDGIMQLPGRTERLTTVIRDYNRQLKEAA